MTAKSCVVSSSEIFKYDTMSASFFVTAKNSVGPHGNALELAEKLEAQYSKAEAMEMIREYRGINGALVKDLVRAYAPVEEKTYRQGDGKHAIEAHPYLCLATLINSAEAFRLAAEDKVEATKQAYESAAQKLDKLGDFLTANQNVVKKSRPKP